MPYTLTREQLLEDLRTAYIDMDFVEYLTREIVRLNPIEGCHIVGASRPWLATLVPSVRVFLTTLGLSFHDGKLSVTSAHHGVEFLGAISALFNQNQNLNQNSTLNS